MLEIKHREGKTNSQDCRKRNYVYETYWWKCHNRQDTEIERKCIEGGKRE